MAYRTGDTIRLAANFIGFTGVAFDPTTVELNIYDRNKVLIVNYSGASILKTAVGTYMYDYITPLIKQFLWYEFVGTTDGYPMIARESFEVKW